MINNYWHIGDKGSFKDTRGARIGSSDIPYLFPSEERPTESLAAYTDSNGKRYPNTAIDLYKRKTGEKVKRSFGLPAEMGHTLENKSLELFIRKFFSYELGVKFRISKEQYENDLLIAKLNNTELPNPENYQVGLFRHNVEYYDDGMIVHPDCIYLGHEGAETKTVDGITVDLSKPFFIEAKSATKDSTKRRDSLIKGYDFTLSTWHGVPFKHVVQMQFQGALFQIDTGYLALLHNTSEFQVWRVDKDKKLRGDIIDIVGKMLKYIEMKVMPKELAICLDDVISLYPKLKNDFVTVTGDKAEKIKEICKKQKHAKKQIKNWEDVEQDCKDALAVEMKDFDEIKDGADTLVKWKINKGRESVGLDKEITGKLSFLNHLKLNDKAGFNYINRKGWYKIGNDSRSIDVKYKG